MHGYGTFANRAFEEGEIVTYYARKIHPKYLGLGAYINDPRISDIEPNVKAANTRFVMVDSFRNQDLFLWKRAFI